MCKFLQFSEPLAQLLLAKADPLLPVRRAFTDSIYLIFFSNFFRLYVSGFCYNRWHESILWRLAIVEVLVGLVPIEVAGIVARFRPLLFGG